MAIEIERKFLVKNDDWRPLAIECKRLRQAYLAGTQGSSVRVRIVNDAMATLTIKSEGAHTSRLEFEYVIPLSDATSLMGITFGHVVSKQRYLVPFGGLTWEIDVFDGENAGLIIAEVELTHENQSLEMPLWAGREITREEQYSNSSLAHRPYRRLMETESEVVNQISAEISKTVP